MDESDNYDLRLKETIFNIMLEKGLKGMTMDSVATELGISKRTLYEKFTSKSNMVAEVLDMLRDRHQREFKNILSESSNVMEASIKAFSLNRRLVQSLNPSFFREMDSLFPELRDKYDEYQAAQRASALECFRRGVEEGVYRSDVNYEVLIGFQTVQVEALKRMEELFPPELTISDIYGTIQMLMFRSIATEKGMEILNRYKHLLPSSTNK